MSYFSFPTIVVLSHSIEATTVQLISVYSGSLVVLTVAYQGPFYYIYNSSSARVLSDDWQLTLSRNRSGMVGYIEIHETPVSLLSQTSLENSYIDPINYSTWFYYGASFVSFTFSYASSNHSLVLHIPEMCELHATYVLTEDKVLLNPELWTTCWPFNRFLRQCKWREKRGSSAAGRTANRLEIFFNSKILKILKIWILWKKDTLISSFFRISEFIFSS